MNTPEVLKRIDNFKSNHSTKEISNKLFDYKNQIEQIQSNIEKNEFSAIFIGKIGAGKTSAICRLLDLQINEDDSEQNTIDVLKTGAGRTTVCEVQVVYSDKFSIQILPLDNSEIDKIVSNFADFIWTKINHHTSDDDEGGNLLSVEVTRCIRHMLGLTIEKKKTDDGKIKSIDKAIEFAKNCNSSSEVKDYMFQCLDLEARTNTEITPNTQETKNWKQWVRENFSKINDGRNKTISIPQLITIKGPFPLNRKNTSWKIIDTRGIDSNIHRADIREALDSDKGIPIICSSFSDAPDSDCRSFFELGAKLGLKEKLERDAILLVLDKNESDKVADIDEDITNKSERKSLGRDFREEQIINKILHEHNLQPNVHFFDSKIDVAEDLWKALELRRELYIQSKEADILRLTSASLELLNAEEAKAVALNNDTKFIFQEWRNFADETSPSWKNFGEDIKNLFLTVHHRTLAASIDRNGDFYNLNIYEAINQITRSKANEFCNNERHKIHGELKKLLEKYPEFSQQIASIKAVSNIEFEKFAVEVGEVSKHFWLQQVKPDAALWNQLSTEWGRGPGYVRRVITHYEIWLKTESTKIMHQTLIRKIATVWGRVLSNMT